MISDHENWDTAAPREVSGEAAPTDRCLALSPDAPFPQCTLPFGHSGEHRAAPTPHSDSLDLEAPAPYPYNPLQLPVNREWTADEWQLDQAVMDAVLLPRPEIQVARLIEIFRNYLALRSENARMAEAALTAEAVVEEALSAMREPMTLDDARRGRHLLVKHYNATQFAKVRASRTQSPTGD